MKRVLIVAISLFTTILYGYGQHSSYDIEATRKIREYMIMDGSNPDFAWAKQLSDSTLLLGLAPEGEILAWRANEIWKTNIPSGDEALAHIIVRGKENDTLIFARGPQRDVIDSIASVGVNPENLIVVVDSIEPIDPIDVIGAFLPHGNIILGSDMKPLASIDIYGNLFDISQGRLELTSEKAEPVKVAFFYVAIYLVEKSLMLP